MDEVLLSARDVAFVYPRARQPIVSRLNLSACAGEVIAIRGDSGSGKSTVMQLLGLLLRPGEGDVVVAGRSTCGAVDRELAWLRAREIGFLFQDALLDPALSALDNIVQGALYAGTLTQDTAHAARSLMSELGLDPDEHAERLPRMLSGGQAQRVALCRALIKQPRIVIADEPTGSVDVTTTELILDALAGRAQQGALVLIATHDPTVIKVASRTLDAPT